MIFKEMILIFTQLEFGLRRECVTVIFMKSNELLYRIVFLQDEEVCELYSRTLSEESLMGFIEIGDIVFPEPTRLIIDLSEERFREEFKNVKRCYIPMHNILRIDEVQKPGLSTSKEVSSGTNIAHFPSVKKLIHREE